MTPKAAWENQGLCWLNNTSAFKKPANAANGGQADATSGVMVL